MQTIRCASISLAMLSASAMAAVAQKTIPVRQLDGIEAVSTETIGFINGVRELSDGRVVVNDAAQAPGDVRQDLLSMTVIADTTPGRKVQYGSAPAESFGTRATPRSSSMSPAEDSGSRRVGERGAGHVRAAPKRRRHDAERLDGSSHVRQIGPPRLSRLPLSVIQSSRSPAKRTRLPSSPIRHRCSAQTDTVSPTPSPGYECRQSRSTRFFCPTAV